MNTHPIVQAITRRASARGDQAMSRWANHALAGLLEQATLIPAKGFTRREAKLLRGVSHLNPDRLEAMGHQSMPAHILAAALPAGDLALILREDHATRLLTLCGITLHDAGKAQRELSRVTERSDVVSQQAQHNGLEQLALEWGMQPLLEELERELQVSRQVLIAMLSWITSEAEAVRGHNASIADHGLDPRAWREHEDALRMASILARLGDLIASMGNDGKDARAIAREERIARLIEDACAATGKPTPRLVPWTLKRERTMTTMLLQDGVQRAIQRAGGHIWLISRMGGLALLPGGARMPTRDEIDTSFREVISEFIASRTELNPSLTLAGNLPHEKKASAFLLSTRLPGEMPAALLAAARKSFNRKDAVAYNQYVALSMANSLRLLIEAEGIASGNEALARIIESAPQERFPHATWADSLRTHGMGRNKEDRASLMAQREGPLKPADGETPLAEALAVGAAELLKNAQDRRGEQLIGQAISEVIREDLTLPGEASEQLAALERMQQDQRDPCWRCGEPRDLISNQQASGMILMTGYNARQDPGFNTVKAGACRSCILEELLLKAEDPMRKEGRADTYVHVMLDGFTSPLAAGGIEDAAEQLRRLQTWKLASRPEWSEAKEPSEDAAAEADHESPRGEDDPGMEEGDYDQREPDDDAGAEAGSEAGNEMPVAGDRSLSYKQIMGAGSRKASALHNPPATHFSVRFNSGIKGSTAELDAIALGAALSLQLAGMRVMVTGEIQPPQGSRDAHAMSIETPSPTWMLWGAGVRRYGLAELPLVIGNAVSLERLSRLRKKGDNADANALRGVAQLAGHDPLRAISRRFVEDKEETHEASNAAAAIEALEQHLAYLEQVGEGEEGIMNHIRKTAEALDRLQWDGSNGSTHGRTKVLKQALDSLAASSRTGLSWEERQDARDIATGRVQRMLKEHMDPAITSEFVEVVDRELLQGLHSGSVERFRQHINEMVQAVDAIVLARIRERSRQKKAREEAAAQDQQEDQANQQDNQEENA